MPKMKTKKNVVSRFSLTASGKIKRAKAGKRHLLSKKPSKRKRQLKNPAFVSTGMEKMYKKIMGS